MALSRFEPPAFLEGLLCALAATSVMGLMDANVGAFAPAAFVGIWFAIFSVLGGGMLRHSVSGVFGAAGSLAAFIELDAGMTSLGEDARPALLWGIALVVLAAFAWLHGFFLRPSFTRDPWEILYWPLTLFGALEVLSFFVLPFGVSLSATQNPAIAFIATLIGAVLLGGLVGYAPSFALTVFPLFIGASILGITAFFGLPGGSGPQLWDLGAVATYLVLYAVTRVVMSWFVAARS